MTTNKKGLAATNDQAPIPYAKLKLNFSRFATFWIAIPETIIFVAAITLVLYRLWGGK